MAGTSAAACAKCRKTCESNAIRSRYVSHNAPGGATLRTPDRPIFSAAHRRPLGPPVPVLLKQKNSQARASPLATGKPLTRTVLLDCVANLLQVGVDRSDHLLHQRPVSTRICVGAEGGAPKRRHRPRPPRAAGAAAPAPPSSRAAVSFGGSCERRRQMSASFTSAGTKQLRTASSSC